MGNKCSKLGKSMAITSDIRWKAIPCSDKIWNIYCINTFPKCGSLPS